MINFREKERKMIKDKKLAVAPRDARDGRVVSILRSRGYGCVGLFEDCDAVVLPMPYTCDGVTVGNTGVPVRRLFERTGAKVPVLGGRLDDSAFSLAMSWGVRLFDYYSTEGVMLANAALTARAALELPEAECALGKGGRVLVVGFGRIGKCLCSRIPGVTASARKEGDLALIRALGYGCARTAELDLSDHSLVFNTVPHRVLTDDVISRMRPGSVIIDLASPPYGTDFDAAKKYGVTALTAPALPARAYPDEAAGILADSITDILGDRGDAV